MISKKIHKFFVRIKAGIKRIIFKFWIKVIGFLIPKYSFFRSIPVRVNHFIVTFFTAVLAGFLVLPRSQEIIEAYKNIDSIFIAMAGMLGTILVLAFTLSIIPIQRSVEYFTPSISRLYRNDKITSFIFISISIFTLVLFVFSIDSIAFNIKRAILLPAAIAIIGISLDLIRWHLKHVCLLLEPTKAISLLEKNITDFIWGMQKRIERNARISYYSLAESEKAETSPVSLESTMYLSLPHIQNSINNRLSELAELAHKSISRDEVYTTERVINALANVEITYIDCRKDNRLVYPAKEANYLANKSDIDIVVNKIHDHLTSIAERAMRIHDQKSCINVIRALGRIALFTLKLKSADNKKRGNTDLTFSAVYYLGEIIYKGQIAKLDDVVLNGSREFRTISTGAESETRIESICLQIVSRYAGIIQLSFISTHTNFINLILEDMMSIEHYLISIKHFSSDHILREILDNLEHLFPMALEHEKKYNPLLMYFPLSAPYDMARKTSLAYLIEKATSLIEVDKERDWVNPYRDFIELNNTIYMHFRKIVDKEDLGNSNFVWFITHTIKHIVKLHFGLLKNPLTDIYNDLEELVGQITWYISFFWAVFSESSRVRYNNALQACNVLAWVGLSCDDEDLRKNELVYSLTSNVLNQCISNIISIINSYERAGEEKSDFNYADLLMRLWYIRLVAISQKDKYRLRYIDEQFSDVKIYNTEKWSSVKEKLSLRNEQLKDELFGINRRSGILEKETPFVLLRDYLKDEKLFKKYTPETFKPLKKIYSDQRKFVIGSPRTKKYHHPGSKHAINLFKKEHTDFSNTLEAIKQGYTPCKTCYPEIDDIK